MSMGAFLFLFSADTTIFFFSYRWLDHWQLLLRSRARMECESGNRAIFERWIMIVGGEKHLQFVWP